jgi:hypothetical protein
MKGGALPPCFCEVIVDGFIENNAATPVDEEWFCVCRLIL